jgi:hypothetical protein
MAAEMSSPSMFLARLEVEHDQSHRFGGKIGGRCWERWGFELENANGQSSLLSDRVRLKWKIYLGRVPVRRRNGLAPPLSYCACRCSMASTLL